MTETNIDLVVGRQRRGRPKMKWDSEVKSNEAEESNI